MKRHLTAYRYSEEDAEIRKQTREAREILAAIEVMLLQKTHRQQLHLLEVA